MDTNYKRTVAGSVGAGVGAIFNASGRKYYILEHKTESAYHHLGESQKIIIDQIELGRDGSCQVRFDESMDTVSRRHAAIVKDGENWKIIPLSQTNATFVNSVAINSETILHNGDEIKLSSNGPVIGFIIPQGENSMVKSIGLTERMNLFRKQALRPYKTAIWILAVVLLLAVAGLVTYNIIQDKAYAAEMAAATEKIEAAQTAVDELSERSAQAEAELAAADARLKEANAELDEIKQDANATKEELKAAQQRVEEADERAKVAQNVASSARKAAQKATEELSNAQQEFSVLKNGLQENVAATVEQTSGNVKNNQKTSNNTENPADVSESAFADIENCSYKENIFFLGKIS